MAKISSSIVRQLDGIQWRRFVDQHPQSNIFHTPEMYEVFKQTKGHRPTLWAAVDSGNYPLALLLPVEISLFDGLLQKLTTRAVVYGGVLAAPSADGKQALQDLLQTYIQNSENYVIFTEVRNLSDTRVERSVLIDCGFSYEDHLNFLVDLNHSPEAVLQGIGKRTRKKIRSSLRKGELIIEEIKQDDQVKLCYDLLEKTYARAKVPLADYSLFEAAFDALHSKGMIKFLLAYVGDVCVGTSVELLFKDKIYGWYGGSDRRYSKYYPNEMLMWHILNWGAQNRYNVYDFGGAGKPGEEYGVRNFKAKFGGNLVNFGRFVYVHAPNQLILSKFGYRFYRRFL